MHTGKLFLIPTPLGNGKIESVIPQGTLDILHTLKFFIVEELRTARRYLNKAGIKTPIEELVLSELNEHSLETDLPALLKPIMEGNDMGLLSEAGAPAVADPGANLIALAHRRHIEVIPLVGPSSILLALMASGLNGQSFAFAGYLPVKSNEREQCIRQLEKHSIVGQQTQIFIETPYRNHALLNDLLASCAPHTLLCIAANITMPDAYIHTKTIAEWKKTTVAIHKKPSIFLLQGVGKQKTRKTKKDIRSTRRN
ncbi:MAG: SAM-dependent methyltransferase [Spirochaetaceae bacterium]|nr:SAM-dependent methyltransferase [Spirochaetaceae bacterium]